MKIRLASDLQTGSIVDGEGLRAVIWTQGCIHNCYGCHNPSTHSKNGGFLTDTEVINHELDSLTLEDGITFSGGDPMMQIDACLDIARHANKLGLNIWCYTGYTFEQLLKMSEIKPSLKEFMSFIDVLVDGKFVLSQRSLNLKFRGSRNQRIIFFDKPKENYKFKYYVATYVNDISIGGPHYLMTEYNKESLL